MEDEEYPTFAEMAEMARARRKIRQKIKDEWQLFEAVMEPFFDDLARRRESLEHGRLVPASARGRFAGFGGKRSAALHLYQARRRLVERRSYVLSGGDSTSRRVVQVKKPVERSSAKDAEKRQRRRKLDTTDSLGRAVVLREFHGEWFEELCEDAEDQSIMPDVAEMVTANAFRGALPSAYIREQQLDVKVLENPGSRLNEDFKNLRKIKFKIYIATRTRSNGRARHHPSGPRDFVPISPHFRPRKSTSLRVVTSTEHLKEPFLVIGDEERDIFDHSRSIVCAIRHQIRSWKSTYSDSWLVEKHPGMDMRGPGPDFEKWNRELRGELFGLHAPSSPSAFVSSIFSFNSWQF